MIIVKLKLVFVMAIFLFNYAVSSQNEEAFLQKGNDESYFSAQLNYISDAVFMGRKDSVTAPYLLSSVKYHHKSGFYLEGSFSYLTKSKENEIDLFFLSAGFDFTFNRSVVDISATKYFFKEDSYKVNSEVEADLTAHIVYDFDIINLALIASSYFNDNGSTDFFLTSDISHDFITTNNKFQFSPSVGICLGSQNFYVEHYINRQKGNGSGSMDGNNDQSNSNLTIQENEKFTIMAIEIGFPMWYHSKSLTFSFLPMLVLPQNEAQLVIDETTYEEDLKNIFYWMIGIRYRF